MPVVPRRTRHGHLHVEHQAGPYQPLGGYREIVSSLRKTGLGTGATTAIPPALVDITAVFIAALVATTDDMDNVVLANFVKRLLHRSDLSCSALLIAVFLLNRLKPFAPLRLPTAAGDSSGCAAFLAALIAADKYIDDSAYANVFWANINGKYTLSQVNALEREFMQTIDYELFVSDVDYDRFLARLDLHIALRQVAHKREFSYADMSVLLTSFSTLPLTDDTVPLVDDYVPQERAEGRGSRVPTPKGVSPTPVPPTESASAQAAPVKSFPLVFLMLMRISQMVGAWPTVGGGGGGGAAAGIAAKNSASGDKKRASVPSTPPMPLVDVMTAPMTPSSMTPLIGPRTPQPSSFHPASIIVLGPSQLLTVMARILVRLCVAYCVALAAVYIAAQLIATVMAHRMLLQAILTSIHPVLQLAV